MTVISHAQNFEDVILWRALKHVQGGFYIDIGAQHPTKDSVSALFYVNGWRGVHVEPNPEYADQLRQARPDETILQIAISEGDKTAPFFRLAGTGLSTADLSLAQEYERAGYDVLVENVRWSRLSDILDRYHDRQVHWLKIDVEGLEASVIRSWQPSPVRPWVVVVEAIAPRTHVSTTLDWEPHLIEMGYRFVYFDGLNRFYLHEAHESLSHHFNIGPNIFDDFFLAQENLVCGLLAERINSLEDEIESLKSQIDRYNENACTLNEKIGTQETENLRLSNECLELRSLLEDSKVELSCIKNSTSWRITAPVRASKRAIGPSLERVRALLPHNLNNRLRQTLKVMIRKIYSLILTRPRLVRAALKFIRLFPPAFEMKVRSIIFRSDSSPAFKGESRIDSPPQLSARAKDFYAQLARQTKRK
ncbi:FkbM family methyltransferase [Nitratireductor basaltis]|uniref:Methyltransferase FkbM family protein n=1 Tax=Nitratireductor basaltis TaxID=472175 RepID=A0A084UD03_9HYPH|nr:FkbM family methyltransferase [Nitratireductor basaltis]KFB10839.1 Methyltransferase FkbM family protein [Nitratireductor basaltis]